MATPALPESPKLQDKPSNPEVLIHNNGVMVESLFQSQVWKEIVFPVLQEQIAGVSGRFTNGRWWHGTLTTNWKENTSLFVAGYQKALMDFHNSLHDFIVAKDNLLKKKKDEESEKQAPIVNPFMEEDNEE